MNVKQEITDLTVCRAFFAAWVFIYHIDLHAQFSAALGPAAGLLHRGYLGVDGFFILSGLILTRVHPEFETSLSGMVRFWGKRLARIYPVHLATIILLAAIVSFSAAMGIAPRDPARFTNVALVQNLLLVHGWGITAHHWAWNYPSWSISTEWAGYLLFPLLAVCFAYLPILVVSQITVICVPVIGLVAYETGQGLNVTFTDALLRFFPEFIAGMAAARMVPLFADSMPTKALAIAGAIILLGATLLSIDGLAAAGLWVVLFALAMHADAERSPIFGNLRFLRWLGRLSYSFYMSFAVSEMLLAQLFRRQNWDPPAHWLGYAAAMTLLTFLLAVFLHIVVEIPCRRLADRLLAADKAAPLAANPQRL